MPRTLVKDVTSTLKLAGTGMVSLGSATAQRSQVFTFAAWVKWAGNATQSIYSGGINDVLFCLTPNGNLRLTQVGVVVLGSSAQPITRQRWTHVAVTFSGTEFKFYVDGSLTDTISASKTFGLGSRWIGYADNGNPSFWYKWEGNLNDVAIFNSVLTDGQIASVMNGIYPVAPSGLYKLNEGTGTTATDSSGNGNNGTITAGSWSTDVPSKKRTAATNRMAVQDFNSSLIFDGSSSKIVVTSPTAIQSQACSFAAWIKMPASTSLKTIFCEDDSGRQLRVTSAGKLSFVKRAVSVIGSSTGNVPVDRWVHVAVTYASPDLNLYIDGQLDTSVSSAVTFSAFGNFNIGVTNASNEYWLGNIVGLRAYNSALTAGQIRSLYNGTSPNSETGLWYLQEGAGTTAYDTSGNGNNGTITNGTWSTDVPSKKRTVATNRMAV